MTKRSIGVVLFDQFELLDVFGPLEMFGVLRKSFEIHLLAERSGTVASAQGPRSVVDQTFDDAGSMDLLLVPGGRGTRNEVDNEYLLGWLRSRSEVTEIVASVCTGSAVLAAAGLLDGRRATSNKMSFEWVMTQGPEVTWVPEARWVVDGKFYTSGGVAAGIDMALSIVAGLLDEEVAVGVSEGTEYDWHRDPSWDPFAKIAGLV